ncbi:MAG TPA: hypothetical protein VIY47_13475, partial [Ignavibacteriaceae bacterium]
LYSNQLILILIVYGLSLFQTNESVRRKGLHNPKLMFIIQLQLFIRQIISLCASEKDPQIFVYIGDFGYFYNTRVHLAAAAAFITFLGLISQILHYLNYKNGIKPSYLKPLQMISGLVSPQSIGLTNEEEIYKLVKVSKTLFVVIKIVSVVMFGNGFVFGFATFIHNFSVKQFLMFGILHSILWGFSCYYVITIIVSNIVYYYIICYYLKLRIKAINDSIGNKLKSQTRVNINFIEIMNSFNEIYEEIHEYNTTYWSKYLFCLWISLVSIINFVAYPSIFGEMQFINRFLASYVSVLFSTILLKVIKTASLVFYETKKTYKLLNSCIPSLRRISETTRLKA